MRRELAERLLAQIMEWSDEEKARERAFLDAFAAYKYDEYQQYSPGRRFLESLALWLRQFETLSERRAAYEFVRGRLVFISEAEMTHLVELAFPTFVRPHLLELAATQSELEPFRVKKILESSAYRLGLRQTLVLGLSDGARTDRFRRSNPQEITNEQIWHAYDVSAAKAEDMQAKLIRDIETLTGQTPAKELAKFRTVVLLDDFTASGTSYLREKEGVLKGKIAKIVTELGASNGIGGLISDTGVKVIIIIYVAAPQAVEHIKRHLELLSFVKGEIEFCVVHQLDTRIRLDPLTDQDVFSLVKDDRYFDPNADDEHGAVGGESVRFGYAGCKLPVVLAHNTPNNSIFLLWAEDVLSVHGLFPRVSRHRTFE